MDQEAPRTTHTRNYTVAYGMYVYGTVVDMITAACMHGFSNYDDASFRRNAREKRLDLNNTTIYKVSSSRRR